MLAAHLNSKLSGLIPSPADKFAIALSGGGDSTALVHALRHHPQRGPVFIVDHALRKGSAAEAETAKSFALALGYDVRILTWGHDNPSSGLQEKARRARYGLMGEQCRKYGIKYLLTAHSEDDQAETLFMRYDRQTDWRGASGMTELSYGALWPELAGVTLCRPLLSLSRQELRSYNRAHNLKWAEDPSNQNRDYARIRARDYLAHNKTAKDDLLLAARDLSKGLREEKRVLRNRISSAQFGQAGDITFTKLPPLELLGQALRCVGGSGAPVDRPRLAPLYHRLKIGEVKAFTFLGAQAVRDQDNLILSRDRVAVTGRTDKSISPRASTMPITDTPQIWDGRFWVRASVTGYHIRANEGLKLQRSPKLKQALAAAHKSVRPTLPVMTHQNMAYRVDELAAIELINLIRPRLEAALAEKNEKAV